MVISCCRDTWRAGRDGTDSHAREMSSTPNHSGTAVPLAGKVGVVCFYTVARSYEVWVCVAQSIVQYLNQLIRVFDGVWMLLFKTYTDVVVRCMVVKFGEQGGRKIISCCQTRQSEMRCQAL